MADRTEQAKAELRVLRFLATGAATLSAASREGTTMLERGDARIAATAEALSGLERAGLVRRDGEEIALSDTGDARLRRLLAQDDPFLGQHRDIEVREVVDDDGRRSVAVNLAESPLALLARRRGRAGGAYLSDRELQAGERLRADFTRGQLMPRLGANWVASVSSGRRAGGVADLTDAALAARIRVERALDAVGPELAGVLTDVCCFLKGMELVETERGWPVRSAKVMLKAALGVLARHYDPPPSPTSRRGTLHWGAEGYRPRMVAPSG